ncbi:SusD/RagB family nutrient-binding outer membrane lipoprotein [Pleomorphovibrio marinus]|uniref:SusD/RagB family nutrient-binding outer membrane lipoprotein n=1 Tax=Pleomorphovibrio marinus TaxID=2164132 RepID=UPI000E0B14FA|nr:SusD/RagB family nutrient-binding outer membrane lipoprotein [Pleomorphovibrio marinus]
MKITYKFVPIVFLLMVALVGCDTEELHNLNINPQAVREIDLNYMFTAAQLGTADGGSASNRYLNWRTNIGYAGLWMQQIASSGTGLNSAGSVYNENFEGNNAPWEYLYGDALKNIAEVIKQTGPGGYDEGNKQNLRQASRILRAFNFHRLTDWYGNIPYFNALNGMDGEFFPEYDPQSTIYPDLLRELEEATAALDPSIPDQGFSRADLYYDGDLGKWRRWGYSIMLRLAMRVSNVAPDLANEYVTKAIAGGVFQSNDDNPYVPHSEGPSQWVNQNGISRSFYPGDGGQQSFLAKTFVDFLKGDEPNDPASHDPRLMILVGGIGNWTAAEWIPYNTDPVAQRGMPSGFDAAMLEAIDPRPLIEVYSRINVNLLRFDSPYQLMNYAEVEFLQAEALERGIGSGIPGTAREHYEAGVKGAMQMYTFFHSSLVVSDQQVENYLARYPYGSKAPLEMIGDQMWASKFFNWWDSWNDWRRTGYPQLVPVIHPLGVTDGQIPRRLRYPAQESASNINFATGATLPDILTGRVWWDTTN